MTSSGWWWVVREVSGCAWRWIVQGGGGLRAVAVGTVGDHVKWWPLPLTCTQRKHKRQCVSVRVTLPNFSVAIHEATFSGVSTSTPKTFPSIAHDVAASSVSDRKTLPLDHVTQLGSLFLRMSPVVPLPVPDNPTSTTTLNKHKARLETDKWRGTGVRKRGIKFQHGYAGSNVRRAP
jgi:hypothetical protein